MPFLPPCREAFCCSSTAPSPFRMIPISRRSLFHSSSYSLNYFKSNNKSCPSSPTTRCCCYNDHEKEKKVWRSLASKASSPYEVLGIDPSCSLPQIKSAFRRKVKEFHPDICKNSVESDAMIRCVIEAYEFLSSNHKSEVRSSENVDPFEKPECEATDLFVDETICMGKGCPYSCVKKAPYAFSFNSETGTARSISQGYAEDYQVQLAVGQCPRRCIYFVTPSQRLILEEILCRILDSPYDPAEVAFLESLIAKASWENNRYQKPKSQPKATSEFVDWY